jgi:hypothetical protein
VETELELWLALPLPLLLDPDLVAEVVAVAVVVVVVVAAVVVVAVVVAFDDSTGSCPLASVTVISSQVATNSATAPPMTRRRSRRVRAARAILCRDPGVSIAGSLPCSDSNRVRIA